MSSPLKEPGYFIFKEWAKYYWREKGQHFETKNILKQNGMLTDAVTNQRYFGDSSTHYTIGDRVKNIDITKVIKIKSQKRK